MPTFENPEGYVFGTPDDDTIVYNRLPTASSSGDGEGGSDRVIVNFATNSPILFSANDFSNQGHFAARFADGAYGPSAIIFGIEHVEFFGGSADDQFVLQLGSTVTGQSVRFDGGSGTDFLSLDASRLAAGLTFLVGNGVITSSFGAFSNLERFSINSSPGNDNITTGAFDDEVNSSTGADVIDTGAGNDRIFSLGGDDTIDGGAGYDSWGADFSSTTSPLIFTLGNTIQGSNGVTVANVEVASFGGGGGDDSMSVTSAYSGVLYGGLGSDTITFGLTDRAVSFGITSYAQDSGANQFSGSGAFQQGGVASALAFVEFDIVNLQGGQFNDSFSIIGLYQASRMSIDGGLGVDTLEANFAAYSTGSTFVVDAGGFVNSNRGSFAGLETFNLFGTGLSDIFVTGAGADVLRGDGGNDRIDGGGGNDSLGGGSGDDILIGGAGDDFLVGDYSEGGGTDRLEGGVGDDRYAQVDGADTIVELVDEGYDTVEARVDFILPQNVEVLYLLGSERLPYGLAVPINGTGNSLDNSIVGNELDNRLAGLAGNDTLDGYAGTDTLDGGLGDDLMRGSWGNDFYLIDSGADRAIEYRGEGYDAAFTASSFTLESGSEIEELRALDANGASPLDLSGNEFNQVVAGNAGANILSGGGGDDYLQGNGGSDTLDGGTGNDVLRGGTGNDYYIIDAAGDRILESVGEGFDTAFSSISFALEAGAEIDALRVSDAMDGAAINLTGNDLNQILAGNSAANILSGGGGDDYLQGNGGNDTLDGGSGIDVLRGGVGDDYYRIDTVSDRVLEALGEGFDTAFTTVSYTLEAEAEIEALRLADESSTAALNLTGNAVSQILSGNAGGNRLNGGGGDDYLQGNGGVDTLDGGTGTDVLRGGADNDYYLIDSFRDRVIEAVGEGYDTVFTTASFNLEPGSEVEELRVADADGVAALSLLGNAFNQVLAGNAGANYLFGSGGDDHLEGRGGNDLIDGGSGNDVLRGGDGADTFQWTILGGTDRILDFVRGTDRIDLSQLDAVTGTTGDDAFAFIGAGAFTSVAGQLRTYVQDGSNYLAGDVNGDGVADFTINLAAVHVDATDILL